MSLALYGIQVVTTVASYVIITTGISGTVIMMALTLIKKKTTYSQSSYDIYLGSFCLLPLLLPSFQLPPSCCPPPTDYSELIIVLISMCGTQISDVAYNGTYNCRQASTSGKIMK